MPFVTFRSVSDRTLMANVRDPQSSADMIATRGEPLAMGLYESWTLLEVFAQTTRQGYFLAVRPHRHHPYVVMWYSIQPDPSGFVPVSGNYFESLEEAWETFARMRANEEARASVTA